MDFVSVRVITDDITRLVGFYERATGAPATWFTADFAEVSTPRATLAIGSTKTLALFGGDIARPAANRSVIIEFLVEDVDQAYRDLDGPGGLGDPVVQPPTTMPWGNRSLLVRDPDGNLVNFFTPVTPAAIAKFSR